jgi:hypothetical protein
MKWIFFFILISCIPVKKPDFKVGDCVLGPEMKVWNIVKEDEDHYLLSKFPPTENSKVEVVKDFSTLRKIDCPE